MTIKPIYLIIAFAVLIIALIGVSVYAIQVTEENNANEAALEKIESDALQELETEKQKREEIKPIQEQLTEDAESNFDAGKALEVEKEQLKNPYYENEPYRINNADSLRIIIARRIKELKNE